MAGELTSMPTGIAPMLATLGELPSPDEDARWAYETKWDGARAVAYVDGGRVRLLSRNDRDVSVSYPELRALGESVGTGEYVLDGEIVAFGTDGKPSFSRLQKRMHVTGVADARRLAESDPVVYVIFDLLYADGTSLLAKPYTERRAALTGLDLNGANWQTPQHFVGGGADLLRASKELGLEGVIAKKLTSAYRPGARSADWIKIKNIRAQEVVVCGWKPGNGRRAGGIGSLLLALPDGDTLTYVGKVGTGFTDRMLDDLLTDLRPLHRTTSPLSADIPRPDAADAQWVTPSLVGEVAFGEWTSDGRLRHPVWRGLRPDKTAESIVRES